MIDAHGGAVVPGFVDPHTHVVFAGDRRDELRRRLTGATYAEIAAEGGGILGTVVATRAATEASWSPTRAPPRRDAALRHDDLRSQERLRADHRRRAEDAARAARARPPTHAIELSPTFMGAHEVPVEYRERRRATSIWSSTR